MPSSVTLKMRVCDHTSHITISARDDGDYDVTIESDCPHVLEYGKRLTRISTEDLLDACTSRINSEEMRHPLSATCLCPVAVMNAAWLEAGMMSKNNAKRAGSNEIIFGDQDERGLSQEAYRICRFGRCRRRRGGS